MINLKAGAVSALLVAAQAWADSPLASAKVYVGPEGSRTIIATVKPASEGKCLLLVTGTTSAVDSLAMPCTTELVQTAQPRTELMWTRRGRSSRAGYTSGDGRLIIFGQGDSKVAMTYNEAESQKVKLDELWAKYQSQKKEVEALAQFDRAAEVVESNGSLKKVVDQTNKACGTTLNVVVDSSPLSDEQFKRMDFSDYCEHSLEQVRYLCEHWKVARSTISARIKAVSCEVGPTSILVFELKEATLVIKTTPDSGDVANALDHWLRENL